MADPENLREYRKRKARKQTRERHQEYVETEERLFETRYPLLYEALTLDALDLYQKAVFFDFLSQFDDICTNVTEDAVECAAAVYQPGSFNREFNKHDRYFGQIYVAPILVTWVGGPKEQARRDAVCETIGLLLCILRHT